VYNTNNQSEKQNIKNVKSAIDIKYYAILRLCLHDPKEIPMKILCFGEVLFDHIDGVHYLGGAPNNFAGHSAMLGSKTYLVSAVGDDELGRRALSQIRSYGIVDTFLQTHPDYPTGTVEVFLEDGIPQYDIAFSAWDHIRLSSADIDQLKQEHFDLFYFGSLAQRTRENAELAGRLMSELSFDDAFFDVNLRQNFFSSEVLEQSLAHTTILKLNDEELPAASNLLGIGETDAKKFYNRIRNMYPVRVMLLTCGSEGAWFYTPETSGHVEPSKVRVVDTVGAGDSFSAGFIRVYKSIQDVEKAARFATHLADFVVGKQGALPAYDAHIRNELERILS
jgi:fructokinase